MFVLLTGQTRFRKEPKHKPPYLDFKKSTDFTTIPPFDDSVNLLDQVCRSFARQITPTSSRLLAENN